MERGRSEDADRAFDFHFLSQSGGGEDEEKEKGCHSSRGLNPRKESIN